MEKNLNNIGLRVPDDYFANLQEQIMQNIRNANKPICTKRHFIPYWSRIVSYAACTIFFTIGAISLYHNISPAQDGADEMQMSYIQGDYDSTDDLVMLDNNELYSFIAEE